MRTTLLLLLLLPLLQVHGQTDTLMGRAPSFWTDPPPVMNLVEAGLDLQRSARMERTAWLMAGAGVIMGTVFWVGENERARDVCYALGGGGWVIWNLASIKPKEDAGVWLQQGWRDDRLYEALPDSVGPAQPVRRGRVNR